MHFSLDYFDDETRKIEAATTPFAAKVLPLSPGLI